MVNLYLVQYMSWALSYCMRCAIASAYPGTCLKSPRCAMNCTCKIGQFYFDSIAWNTNCAITHVIFRHVNASVLAIRGTQSHAPYGKLKKRAIDRTRKIQSCPSAKREKLDEASSDSFVVTEELSDFLRRKRLRWKLWEW